MGWMFLRGWRRCNECGAQKSVGPTESEDGGKDGIKEQTFK